MSTVSGSSTTNSDEKKKERKFFSAVCNGDEKGVSCCVLKPKFNINCANESGETGLQLAVKINRHKIADILLEKGAEVGGALQQAVAKDSVEWVRKLLDFAKDTENRSAGPSNEQQTSQVRFNRIDVLLMMVEWVRKLLDFAKDTENRSAGPSNEQQTSKVRYNRIDVPLMMTTHNDNQDIMKLYLEEGFTIEEPPFHRRSCECEKWNCQGTRVKDSLDRLQIHRALASPVYLCMSYLLDKSSNQLVKKKNIALSKDPIVRALRLNQRLNSLADAEYEFKADYKQFSNNCEEFAMALLAECRTEEEISYVMMALANDQGQHEEVRRGPEAQNLSLLEVAIDNGNEKFVAHPYNQLMLNLVLYDGLWGLEDLGLLKKVVCSVVFTLLLLVLALIYSLVPNCQVSTMLKKPFVKFVSHVGSFYCFLLLLVLSSVQDKFYNVLQYSVIAIFISLWIAGQLLQEAKKVYHQGKERYISQYWNLVTLLRLMLFLVSGILWLTGFIMTAQRFGGTPITVGKVFGDKAQVYAYRLILSSNATFSIGLLLSFVDASNFFQVNSILGPLQLSLVKMMRDIVKFLFLFLLLFLAFGWAKRKVYSQYVQARETFEGNETEHEFVKIGGSLRYLFWDLFGMSDLSVLRTDKNFIITQYTGEVLLGIYSFFFIVVAINMLIAMMSNSYQRVADDADIQWKFSRTRMWMSYVDEGNVMPPPFNLIPSPQLVFLHCRKFMTRNRIEPELTNKTDIEKRREVMGRLIERYLSTFEKKPCQSDDSQVTVEQGTVPAQSQPQPERRKVMRSLIEEHLSTFEKKPCQSDDSQPTAEQGTEQGTVPAQPEGETRVEIHHQGNGIPHKSEKDEDTAV